MSSEINLTVKPQVWPRMIIVGSFLPGFSIERYAGGSLAIQIRQFGGVVITTSHRRSKPFRLADMLLTIWLRRNDYDVAHITVFSDLAFTYAECVAALLRVLRKSITLSLHGGNLPLFARRQPKRMIRLLNWAHSVACPSRYLVEQMKTYRQDLQLIPNAISVSSYRFRVSDLRPVRLLWLRAFHRIYNPMMAPRMIAKALCFEPQLTLTMVGPDKGDGSLEETRALARELGVEKQIAFLGMIPKKNIPDMIGQHDIFINTTNIDNVPISVIEALACGLPVISTNVGGIPYLIEHGKTGLLVQPGNVQEMAESLKRLLTEQGLASNLSVNGRKLAESFDWNIVLPQWHRLLSAAASGAV